MKSKIFPTIIIIFSFIFSFFIIDQSFAENSLTSEEETIFSQNDLIFYEPCGSNPSSGAGLLEGKDNKEKIWNWFVNANIEGVSNNPTVIAGIMGNLQTESSFNPFATNGSGYYGLFQTNSSDFKTTIEKAVGTHWGESSDDTSLNDKAIQAELEWLSKNERFQTFVKNLDQVDNTSSASSYAELFLVEYERPVCDPSKGMKCVPEKITDIKVIKYVKNMYNGKLYDYQGTNGRRENAEEIYKYATGNMTSGDNSNQSNPSCNSCEQGSMNINGAAVCLAWPLDSKADASWKTGSATDLFNTALNKLDSDHGNTTYQLGADCGRFTSIVVQWSGVDKNFPGNLNSGSENQLSYARGKGSDKWDVYKWDDTHKPQAGDILLGMENENNINHSYIYIEDENGENYIAEASYESHYGKIYKKEKKINGTQYNLVYILHPKNAQNSTTGVNIKDGVKSSDNGGATATTTNNSKGSHNINASALQLAWPAGTNKTKYDLRVSSKATGSENFQKYWEEIGKGKDNRSDHVASGASCDYFVSAVLKYAGLPIGSGDNIIGGVGNVRSAIESNSDWEKITITNKTDESQYQPGDVLFNGNSHVALYIKNTDGKGYIAEASNNEYWGAIHVPFSDIGRFDNVIYRNKKNTNSASSCNRCPNRDDNTNLKDGGYTSAKEAEAAIISAYKKDKLDFNGIGLPCGDNYHKNCVNFTKWFINEYLGWEPTFTGNGADIADNFYNKFSKKYSNLKKSKTPTLYSVASWSYGDGSGMASSSDGHTGIIVGINQKADTILIAQAGYCKDSGSVVEKKLSSLNGKGIYIDISSYLNNTGLQQ